MPHTRPWSSSTGFGSVTNVTATVTTASTTKAAPAPQNDSSEVGAEARAMPALVAHVGGQGADRAGHQAPQARPQGVIRFQNIPMMNVANSGALKIENSACM